VLHNENGRIAQYASQKSTTLDVDYGRKC